jgi:hypothetical protein
MPPVHAWPQTPQSLALVCRFSHVAVHSVSGAAQEHAPVASHVSPPVQAVHPIPPDRQLALVSRASGSQVVAFVQQPVQPLVALHAHVPFVHIVPAPHTWPHAPQLALSAFSSTHAPVQALRPALHPRPQTRFVHAAIPPPAVGGGQITPQPPQLAVSVASSTH